MSERARAVQLAIEALARQCASPWQTGEGPPDAYLTVRGRRIALDVAVMAEPGPRRKRVARARLREDAVARRVVRDLEGAVRPHVPNGKTVIVTLGAPIKVAKKLVADLTNELLGYLERGAQDIDEKRTILGNRVRFRVLETDSKWKVGVIGFVFTGDLAPSALAKALLALHGEIGAKAKRRMPDRFAGERWLLLVSDDWIGDVRTFRRAYSVLPPQQGFRRIWMVEGGRVFALAES
jgi:hypothetical protein